MLTSDAFPVSSDVSKALILTEIGAKRDPATLDIFLGNMRKMLSAPTHGYATLSLKSCTYKPLLCKGDLWPLTRRVRIIGSSTLALCHIASGAAEAYYQYGLHCWDIAAAAVIIREAGGCVIDTSGQHSHLNQSHYYYYFVTNAGGVKLLYWIIKHWWTWWKCKRLHNISHIISYLYIHCN